MMQAFYGTSGFKEIHQRQRACSSLYLFEGFALFLGNRIEADVKPHSHHLLKIFISLDHSFEIEHRGEFREVEIAIIAPDEAHRFASDEGSYAVLYLDGESEAARYLCSKYIGSHGLCLLPELYLMPAKAELMELEDGRGSISKAECVSKSILGLLLGPYGQETVELDPRIKKVIAFLKESPDKKVKIEVVARHVGLSESRLIHLFTHQVGVPPRRYALWLRLLDAIDEIVDGASFTDAAYAAGFSDSAHLSRTFRKMFGLSLVEVFKSTSVASSFKRL
ncbi:MAG TPA: AraC family transcriptional regulator [Rectinema sp.]|nr:helix-turn-helix transcriptional regulator [Treponema sp.]HNP92982.1 AraC family transcriptional regulator [Rectinema sp.]HNT59103.1 AraC family transcriptional regulator [Rectinema sp.]HOI98225.1 AraC family transcriptional regulator [Rectinema sp.]HPG91369.1 AraC family transcriptional regulator [Rectinema sp.]